MIDWFRRWTFRRLDRTRAVEAVERALARLEDSARRLRRLERRILELERGTAKLMGRIASQVERVRAVAETTSEDVKDAEQSVEQSERAMEILRTEREADLAAIETLTARIKEYQALSEANIAHANHRRGQMTPGFEQSQVEK